eukprot:scaffold6463_cov405-Prasinococcus_capsulatus_cf.AAC.3
MAAPSSTRGASGGGLQRRTGVASCAQISSASNCRWTCRRRCKSSHRRAHMHLFLRVVPRAQLAVADSVTGPARPGPCNRPVGTRPPCIDTQQDDGRLYDWMVTGELWPHLAALVGPQAGDTAPAGHGLLRRDQLYFELSLHVPPQVEE